MANVIQILRSTSTATPSAGAMEWGQLAFSEQSDKLFYKNDSGNVIEIGGAGMVNDAISAALASELDDYLRKDIDQTYTGDELTIQNALKVEGALSADSGATFGDDVNLGNNKLLAVATPNNGTDGANKDYVDSKIQGVEYRESVINIQNDPPGSPTAGDRYIVGLSPTGDWSGNANDIAEYNGTSWDFESPNSGWAAWIEDGDRLKVFSENENEWVKLGSTVVHENLSGLQGGNAGAGEFFHLTQTEHDRTVAFQNASITTTYSQVRDHVGATSGNPHQVSLEEARTQSNVLAGDVDMDDNALLNAVIDCGTF